MNDQVKKATILIIDDEAQMRRLLKITLESHGYEVLEAVDGQKGLELLMNWRPQLVILDLGLPDMDGTVLLRNLREWTHVPVLILSAKDDEETIVEVLDSGADDYLTKPFSLPQLLARMRVCLRRVAPKEKEVLYWPQGDLRVHLGQRQIFKGEEEVKLTSTEFDLMKLFIQNAGKVLTHRQILKDIWGPHHVDHVHYLRVYIGHLRHKIEKDPNRPLLIVTESGVGYRLIAPASGIPSFQHKEEDKKNLAVGE